MDFVPFNAPSHPALNKLRDQINTAAKAHNVPPCALAAVVMRESGGQNILQEGMPPGDGCGVGVCQITSGVDWADPANPTYQGLKLLEPANNLEIAARFFLAPAIAECQALRMQYGPRMNAISSQILYFAFCSYNAGFGTVRNAVIGMRDPDAVTTDRYGAGTLSIYNALVTESHNTQ